MKLFSASLATAILVASSANLIASDFKMATVDLAKAFVAMPDTKATEEKINRSRREAKAQFEAITDPAAKQAFQSRMEKELQAESAKGRAEIIRKLQAAVAAVQKEGGYALVVDTSGKTLNAVPAVFVADGTPDITDAVVAKMKE